MDEDMRNVNFRRGRDQLYIFKKRGMETMKMNLIEIIVLK